MDEQPQKTGVIYCRVSSHEQVQGTSLAMQERLCREYAARENIQVIACFVEEGESAKTADRTEFQKALQFCADKKQRVDFFIVHKIDRFARNQDDHAITQAFLKKYGTRLRSVTEQIDETPMGRMMEGILATFAEFDNSVRAMRSKSGMVEKVKKGIWVWKAPLGYQRLTKGGNIIADETVAYFIKMIFVEWSKGGYTFQSLSDFMEAQGFRTRTGKKPCAQLVEKILRNPVYCAKIRVWGHEYDGTFEAIVSEQLFWKCQPSNRSNFDIAPRVVSNSLFPLRRFAMCPDCGRALTGSASTGRGGVKYPYYHHQKQACPVAAFIPKETLEQNFVEFLQSVSPRSKNEKMFRAVVMDIWQSNYRKLDADNSRLRKEIEALEAERQRIFDMHRVGKYTDDEFLEQKEIVNSNINQKKNLLDDKRIEEFNMDEALEYCFNFVRYSGSTWEGLEKLPVLRARFQKSVFPEKVSFDGKEFGTKKMSLVYELNQDKHVKKSHLLTQVGKNWNQLVYELNGWHRFGRDVEDALNNEENRTLQPVR